MSNCKNVLCFDPATITKDTKLIRTIGGKRMVHVTNCSYIKNWTIEGAEAIKKYNPGKMKVCPTCERLVLLADMSKDYAKNKVKYSQLISEYKLSVAVLNKLFAAKCKVELCGNKLFITKKKDIFYISFEYDDIRLFHNNYNVSNRDNGSIDSTKGYHEHDLFSEDSVKRFDEALRQIANYEFEEAKKTHAKSKPKKGKMTFSEYDEEYWGFASY